jgi:hypothetical protein
MAGRHVAAHRTRRIVHAGLDVQRSPQRETEGARACGRDGRTGRTCDRVASEYLLMRRSMFPRRLCDPRSSSSGSSIQSASGNSKPGASRSQRRTALAAQATRVPQHALAHRVRDGHAGGASATGFSGGPLTLRHRAPAESLTQCMSYIHMVLCMAGFTHRII